MTPPTVYRTIRIDGLSIFYRQAGPREAPTLLLLHGLPSLSRCSSKRHVGNDPSVDRNAPDLWTHEFAFLSKPGQADIQSDLFYDYRTNVEAYPKLQAWMREKRQNRSRWRRWPRSNGRRTATRRPMA